MVHLEEIVPQPRSPTGETGRSAQGTDQHDRLSIDQDRIDSVGSPDGEKLWVLPLQNTLMAAAIGKFETQNPLITGPRLQLTHTRQTGVETGVIHSKRWSRRTPCCSSANIKALATISS